MHARESLLLCLLVCQNETLSHVGQARQGRYLPHCRWLKDTTRLWTGCSMLPCEHDAGSAVRWVYVIEMGFYAQVLSARSTARSTASLGTTSSPCQFCRRFETILNCSFLYVPSCSHVFSWQPDDTLCLGSSLLNMRAGGQVSWCVAPVKPDALQCSRELVHTECSC